MAVRIKDKHFLPWFHESEGCCRRVSSALQEVAPKPSEWWRAGDQMKQHCSLCMQHEHRVQNSPWAFSAIGSWQIYYMSGTIKSISLDMCLFLFLSRPLEDRTHNMLLFQPAEVQSSKRWWWAVREEQTSSMEGKTFASSSRRCSGYLRAKHVYWAIDCWWDNDGTMTKWWLLYLEKPTWPLSMLV